MRIFQARRKEYRGMKCVYRQCRWCLQLRSDLDYGCLQERERGERMRTDGGKEEGETSNEEEERKEV